MDRQSECLVDSFYAEDRYFRINEIVKETLVLKEFKTLMVKHAFDCMSETFQHLYYKQEKFLAGLKKEYKERYGA